MMGPYSSPLNNHKYNFIFINESGLYSLISNSKKPEAKKFKHWVTSEVLPSIRKQGYYKLFNNYHKNNMFLIESENDLHHKVVSFIRKKYNDICLMVAGLGEFQTTSIKRISCWKKGYMKGQPDLIIQNCHPKFMGLCIEFKSPTNKYQISEAQIIMKKIYEKNKYKFIISSDYDEIIYEIIQYMEKHIVYLTRREKYMKGRGPKTGTMV